MLRGEEMLVADVLRVVLSLDEFSKFVGKICGVLVIARRVIGQEGRLGATGLLIGLNLFQLAVQAQFYEQREEYRYGD